jgi:hypothetical protein
MGTFIKGLSGYISEQNNLLEESQPQFTESDKALKDAIAKLDISENERENLEKKLSDFRNSSRQRDANILNTNPSSAFVLSPSLNLTEHMTIQMEPLIAASAMDPAVVFANETCVTCFKSYTPDSLQITGLHQCPECRKNPHGLMAR